MRKRSHVVSFHLNAKELKRLDTLTQLSGWTREEFLRSLIMGAQLRAKPCPHHADLMRKVAGLCNNANQLAHTANSTGQASQQSIDEMLRLVGAVMEEVREHW